MWNVESKLQVLYKSHNRTLPFKNIIQKAERQRKIENSEKKKKEPRRDKLKKFITKFRQGIRDEILYNHLTPKNIEDIAEYVDKNSKTDFPLNISYKSTRPYIQLIQNLQDILDSNPTPDSTSLFATSSTTAIPTADPPQSWSVKPMSSAASESAIMSSSVKAPMKYSISASSSSYLPQATTVNPPQSNSVKPMSSANPKSAIMSSSVKAPVEYPISASSSSYLAQATTTSALMNLSPSQRSFSEMLPHIDGNDSHIAADAGNFMDLHLTPTSQQNALLSGEMSDSDKTRVETSPNVINTQDFLIEGATQGDLEDLSKKTEQENPRSIAATQDDAQRTQGEPAVPHAMTTTQNNIFVMNPTQVDSIVNPDFSDATQGEPAIPHSSTNTLSHSNKETEKNNIATLVQNLINAIEDTAEPTSSEKTLLANLIEFTESHN